MNHVLGAAVPEGLHRCGQCGELKGTVVVEERPLPVLCLCDGIVCSYCKAAAIRRPISNHYDEATGSVLHTPWFGYLFPCAECRARGVKVGATMPQNDHSENAEQADRVLDLKEEQNADGNSRHVWLRLATNGDLYLEGQDLGPAVAEFWGPDSREYEWAWALTSDKQGGLTRALGLNPVQSDDLPADLAGKLQEIGASEAQRCFEAAGATFWSRVGE